MAKSIACLMLLGSAPSFSRLGDAFGLPTLGFGNKFRLCQRCQRQGLSPWQTIAAMSVPSLPFPHTGVATASAGHRQVLIPYAAMTGVDWQLDGSAVQLPNLEALLSRLTAADALDGDENDLAPPHERMAALWRGWAALAATRSASLPWAALAAASLPECAQSGTATGAWAFMTPCHWAVGADQVRLDNPSDLQLDESQSRTLLGILAPWFAEDGMQLFYDRPDRWLVQGPLLQSLQAASLERVLLRDVRHWVPDSGKSSTLQRLHSEVQMLLYTHPFNEAREALDLSPVNAFWLHGAGSLPASRASVSSAHPEVWDTLRTTALLGNTHSWLQAWQALDAGPMADLLRHVQAGGTATLALCGERNARSFTTAPRSMFQRIQSVFSPQRFSSLREAL